jgi:hypothetical protein
VGCFEIFLYSRGTLEREQAGIETPIKTGHLPADFND